MDNIQPVPEWLCSKLGILTPTSPSKLIDLGIFNLRLTCHMGGR
jgi:hypothetical protein